MTTPLAIRHQLHGNTITSTFNKTTTQYFHHQAPSIIANKTETHATCTTNHQQLPKSDPPSTNQTPPKQPTTGDRPKPPSPPSTTHPIIRKTHLQASNPTITGHNLANTFQQPPNKTLKPHATTHQL